jgi:hypothetical protein
MEVNSVGWDWQGPFFGNKKSSRSGRDKNRCSNGEQKQVKLDIPTPRQGLRTRQDKSPMQSTYSDAVRAKTPIMLIDKTKFSKEYFPFIAFRLIKSL